MSLIVFFLILRENVNVQISAQNTINFPRYFMWKLKCGQPVYVNIILITFFVPDCTFRVPAEDMDIYNQCKELEEKLAFNSWLLKVFTPIFVILVIIALCIGVYLFMKRRKRMKRRLRDRQMAAAKCQGLLSK